jgi:serine/threonine protein kinase
LAACAAALMDVDSHASLDRHIMEHPAQLAQQVDDVLELINSLRQTVAKPESALQDVFFTPRCILAKEFNREMIRKLLGNYGVRDANCDTIHDEYLAVLCTLIRIRKTKYIVYFIRDPESADRYLPFLNHTGWSSECSSFFSDFERAQWEFCAQEFHVGRLDDMRLRPNKIIPITARKQLKKGPDSKVEQIEIHSDYNYFNTAVCSCQIEHINSIADQYNLQVTNAAHPNTFVLKSYGSKHDALYYNEINAYNRLKQSDIAGNVVRLYASWRQNQTYCILLEFVNGGTLADLFRSPHPVSAQERLSFWRNMVLILEPLARLHQHTDPNDSQGLVEGYV